jgi:hypothetical protein
VKQGVSESREVVKGVRMFAFEIERKSTTTKTRKTRLTTATTKANKKRKEREHVLFDGKEAIVGY